MYYLMDVFGVVVMTGESPPQFPTEEEAEGWVEAKMECWQVMEGRLRAGHMSRARRRSEPAAS